MYLKNPSPLLNIKSLLRLYAQLYKNYIKDVKLHLLSAFSFKMFGHSKKSPYICTH